MSNRDYKDLARRTSSDKVLHHKAFNTANNLLYDEYLQGIASMVHKTWIKTKGVLLLQVIKN